jgi:hypothetical protein
MLSLILAAAAAALVPPTPVQYYSQALATMQRLPQPAYISFQTTVSAHGWGIAQPCDHGKIEWAMGWGRNLLGHVSWQTLYTSANNAETIRTVTGDTCSGPAETFDRPTWSDAYAWVRYGFDQSQSAPAQNAAAHSAPSTLKTIADVSVIAPGAYRVTDGGPQLCPSGSPGHLLHFAARFDPLKHLLRDAVIDSQSMRICMIRFDLDSMQAVGTEYRGDIVLDFGDVKGNWIITRGHAVMAVRMAGISLKTFALDFGFSNISFPATLSRVGSK